MKAMVCAGYGAPDMLRLADVQEPTPKDNQVLVRVHAAAVNDWDWAILRGAPFLNRMLYGLRKPKIRILGADIAGRIESVGRDVKRFRPGDEVFGDLSSSGFGGFAEYVCAPEHALALKSPKMTFEQAAAIPQAAMLAVQGLRDVGRISEGQKLLINGAGGGVGTFAIQIAKLYGVEMTAVDSPGKLDMLRSLGADHLVDYTQEDFTKTGKRYDLILDVKTNRPVSHYVRALAPKGIYATVGGNLPRLAQVFMAGPVVSKVRQKTVRLVVLKPNKDLAYMKELFEAGSVVPVIDGPYELRDLPRAFRHFGAGEHRGKVIIAVA